MVYIFEQTMLLTLPLTHGCEKQHLHVVSQRFYQEDTQ